MIENIIGAGFLIFALFMYFVGKDIKEKDIQDGVLSDVEKAKKVNDKVKSFNSDDIIDKLSKYKK